MQNTYWGNEERRANTSLKKYLEGCVWEGVRDRTELQYIDPHTYGHQRCIFLVLQGCSTGGPGAHSAGCGLSLPHLVSNSSELQLTDFLSSPSYIIVQSPTQYLFSWLCHFRRLWIGMFDHHQAEITVIQYRGHSLPVHQSMSILWDFTLSHFVSQARLRDFFSKLPSECVTSFWCITLEWHVWPGRRSIYNTRGGRELASIEDCVDAEKQGLKDYIKKRKERWFTSANSSIGNIRTNRYKI